ncbi:MAG: dihydrodipicolinate synthase family protein, partial [Paludibacteraceae bacterium]|nr:dihydrodipicolinate synthase family protein [Paludibacteraceae bacterium]
MSQTALKGLGIALITPFTDNDEVDYQALGRLIDYQVTNGVDYMVILGTTGETPTLSEEEKAEVTRFSIERIAGRVPVVLGVGGNNTAALVKRLKNDPLTGVDAILSVVPYYNKPSQEGIYQHYAAIAEASPVPVIMYNVPGRTGVNMNPELTIRLAKDFPEKLVAIKEASG